MTRLEMFAVIGAACVERYDFTDPSHYDMLAECVSKITDALMKKNDALSQAEEDAAVKASKTEVSNG